MKNSTGPMLINRRILYLRVFFHMQAYVLDPELNEACRAIKPIFVSGNRASIPQERSMCYNGKNQTDGAKYSLHVWPPKAKKGLPDKCKTIIFPSKSSTMHRVAEYIKRQLAFRHMVCINHNE